MNMSLVSFRCEVSRCEIGGIQSERKVCLYRWQSKSAT